MPTNITIKHGTNGTTITWDYTPLKDCAASAITYNVTVTRISDGDVITIDNRIMSAFIPNLLSNESYTIAVAAIAGFCASDPIRKNFSVPQVTTSTGAISKH